MDSADRKRKWDEPAGDTEPEVKPPVASGSSDAASQAAAIAAKIAASLRGPPGAQGHELVKTENKDEGFVKDIEINDLRNRYVLTKGSTQKQVIQVSLHLRTPPYLPLYRLQTRLEPLSSQKVSGYRIPPSCNLEKPLSTSTSLAPLKSFSTPL